MCQRAVSPSAKIAGYCLGRRAEAQPRSLLYYKPRARLAWRTSTTRGAAEPTSGVRITKNASECKYRPCLTKGKCRYAPGHEGLLPLAHRPVRARRAAGMPPKTADSGALCCLGVGRLRGQKVKEGKPRKVLPRGARKAPGSSKRDSRRPPNCRGVRRLCTESGGSLSRKGNEERRCLGLSGII